MQTKMIYSIMKKDVVNISENATLTQAAELMHAKRIRHLPVANETGRIVGILTDRDTRIGQALPSGQENSVKQFMNFPVMEVSARASIGDVAKRMIENKISCLLVVDEYEAPWGIVTSEDLLRYLVDLTEETKVPLNTPVGMIFQYLKVPTYE